MSCDGKEVDHRTQQSHILRDRKAQGIQQSNIVNEVKDVLVEKATEAAGLAIQNQLDAITHHLATITLSTETPSSISGINSPPANLSSSQARTHRLLTRLGEIEASANDLDVEVTAQLQNSALPSFLNSQTFPLTCLISKCRLLDGDLIKITSKSAAVTAAKDAIKSQIDVLVQKLLAAKKIWKERQKVELSARPTECTTQYSTGQ